MFVFMCMMVYYLSCYVECLFVVFVVCGLLVDFWFVYCVVRLRVMHFYLMFGI